MKKECQMSDIKMPSTEDAMIDFDLRDRLIHHIPYDSDYYHHHQIRYFQNLRRHESKELLDTGTFSLYPWAKYAEFWWFIEMFGNDDKLYLHGFTYSKEKTVIHGGIVLNGIGRDQKFHSEEAKKVFEYLFAKADQFKMDPPWCW